MHRPEELGPVGDKLVQALGRPRAVELVTELIPRLTHDDPSSAVARYEFGIMLTEREEALLQVLGRCIKAQAILHGALRGQRRKIAG